MYDAFGKEYLDFAAGIAVNALGTLPSCWTHAAKQPDSAFRTVGFAVNALGTPCGICAALQTLHLGLERLPTRLNSCVAGHGDPRWLEAVTDQAAMLSHTSNLFHNVPQVPPCTAASPAAPPASCPVSSRQPSCTSGLAAAAQQAHSCAWIQGHGLHAGVSLGASRDFDGQAMIQPSWEPPNTQWRLCRCNSQSPWWRPPLRTRCSTATRAPRPTRLRSSSPGSMPACKVSSSPLLLRRPHLTEFMPEPVHRPGL